MIARVASTILVIGTLLSPVYAHPGTGIVMDSKGNVYYTDLVNVWKITTDGRRSIAVSDVHTHELYLDAKDNLYGEHEWYEGEASDKWGNYVWCLKNNGQLVKTIPDVEGFLANTTLVRDAKDNSYWARKQGKHQLLMQQLSTGENILFSAHLFNDIRWIYYSSADSCIYVVDEVFIKQVSPVGKVKTIANNLKEEGFSLAKVDDRHYVYAPWTNAKGELYIPIYGAGKVNKLLTNNKMKTVYESPPGWSPCGGLIDLDGSLWIMEFSNFNRTRVSKICPGGGQKIFE